MSPTQNTKIQKIHEAWAVAHASWIFLILVFRVRDMFYISRPAATTAAAFIALLRRRTITTRINNRGPMGPGVAGLAVVF